MAISKAKRLAREAELKNKGSKPVEVIKEEVIKEEPK